MTDSVIPAAPRALHVEGAFDADAWLRRVAWLVVLFSCVQILLFSFGRDQGIYAVVADVMARGGMPYRDVWDFKPPGIFHVYQLAQGLFGRNMVAPRILEVAGLLATVVALRWLSHVWFGERTIGVVAGAVAALLHAQLEFWHTAQPETFGGYLTILAMLLTVWDPSRRRLVAWAAVGVSFGLCFLLKPPMAGGALVCAAYLARREAWRGAAGVRVALPFLVVAAASAVPIALCAAWFRARGAWPALHQTLFEFTPHYTAIGWVDRSTPAMLYVGIQEGLTKYSALLPAALVAAVALPALHSREREAKLMVLGVSVMHFVGIAMQGKFFPYHFGATFPVLAIVAGLGIYKVWRRALGVGAPGVVALAVALVLLVLMRDASRDVPHGFWKRSWVRLAYALRSGGPSTRAELDAELYYVADYDLAADRRVADALVRLAPPDAPVFVWGFEPVVYWLSDRHPPTRFIYNVAQRVEWSRDWSQAELARDLRRAPPAVIVVEHHDVFPMVTGDAYDSHRSLERFPELADMLSTEYEHAERIQDFDLYVRTADRAP